MAAGLGFKTFNSGDVLSAADVNGYLMQGVLVFASTAARDAAITAPAEGQFAFTKDTNSLFYYDGAAWVASGATGDIEGVTAGTGISGGGTSGTVTVTNSMATAIDAKGDLIVGTGADTFSRLAAGTNTYVLTADSAEATGLKWSAPAGGGAGLTLVKTQTIGSAVSSVTVSSAFSSTYDNYLITINGGVASTTNTIDMELGSTTTGYYYFGIYGNATSGTVTGEGGNNVSKMRFIGSGDTSLLSGQCVIQNPNLAKATAFYINSLRTGTNSINLVWAGSETSTTQHTAFTLYASTGTITGGTIRVYGYSNS
jgi:hypothetical protein